MAWPEKLTAKNKMRTYFLISTYTFLVITIFYINCADVGYIFGDDYDKEGKDKMDNDYSETYNDAEKLALETMLNEKDINSWNRDVLIGKEKAQKTEVVKVPKMVIDTDSKIKKTEVNDNNKNINNSELDDDDEESFKHTYSDDDDDDNNEGYKDENVDLDKDPYKSVKKQLKIELDGNRGLTVETNKKTSWEISPQLKKLLLKDDWFENLLSILDAGWASKKLRKGKKNRKFKLNSRHSTNPFGTSLIQTWDPANHKRARNSTRFHHKHRAHHRKKYHRNKTRKHRKNTNPNQAKKEISIDNAVLKYHELIGVPQASDIRKAATKSSLRVIDGRKAKLGELYYMAGLVIPLINGHLSMCGATILGPRHLITAAHCWRDGRDSAKYFTVVVGSLTLFEGGTRIVTNDVVVHPKYNKLKHDLAIIRVKYPIAFNKNVRPALLPSAELVIADYEDAKAKVSGYGKQNEDQIVDITQTLHVKDVKIISNRKCAKMFTRKTVNPKIICATAEGGSTCGGDSGGPLVVKYRNESVLIGVASFGALDCSKYKPAGFVRVTAYLDWINSQIYNEKS